MIFRPKDKRRTTKTRQAGTPAAKYYRSGKISAGGKSPFAKNTRQSSSRRRWLGRGVDVVILTSIMGLLVYSLVVKSTPTVTVNDTSYNSKATYELAARKEFSGIRTKNKITLNEQKISDNLKKQFPEISNVTIELPLIGQTPLVVIEVARPTLKMISANATYVVNSQGVVTGLASGLPATNGLIEVTDRSGFHASTGKQVLEASAVGFIEALKAQLGRSNVPISSLTLPAKAQELDLRTADQPYFVKFFLGGDPAAQIGQLLATRVQFARDGIQPNDYLDVRVQGKIFYK